MANLLNTLHAKKIKLCVGIMSGTSLDGIDVALVKIFGSGIKTTISVLDWNTYAYPTGLNERIQTAVNQNCIKLSEITQLNVLLGELYAQAVLKLLKKNKLNSHKVDLIGCHGQTVWHNPKPKILFGKTVRSTLQLGESSVIQARTGIVTISDFRSKDVALGGEGAPLMPYFDYIFFRSNRENRGVLNIGGIANITIIPRNASLADISGFDTGPGNMIIDQLMGHYFGKLFDSSGRIARKEFPDAVLLSKLMRHSLIKKSPPKSSGREDFGAYYVHRIIGWSKELKLSPEQVISTVTELTIKSIIKNYELHIQPQYNLDRIVVSGGGIHNSELMRRFRTQLSGSVIESSDSYGIPSDAKEAAAFAFFANETISGNHANIPGVTGARSTGILGKIVV